MLQLAIALVGARCIVFRLGIIGRFSEIPSEAILGIVYMARGKLLLAVHMHLLSQLTWNFYERRYYGWQNSIRWGNITRRTTGEFSSAWKSDHSCIAISIYRSDVPITRVFRAHAGLSMNKPKTNPPGGQLRAPKPRQQQNLAPPPPPPPQ